MIDLDALPPLVERLKQVQYGALIAELRGSRKALAEIARGEVSGFELQQIAIRALVEVEALK